MKQSRCKNRVVMTLLLGMIVCPIWVTGCATKEVKGAGFRINGIGPDGKGGTWYARRVHCYVNKGNSQENQRGSVSINRFYMNYDLHHISPRHVSKYSDEAEISFFPIGSNASVTLKGKGCSVEDIVDEQLFRNACGLNNRK